MARKKKVTELVVEPVKAEEIQPVAEPVAVEEELPGEKSLALTEIELLKVGKFEAEIQVLQTQAQVRGLQRDMHIMKIDPHGVLAAFSKEIADLQKVANEKRERYREVLGVAGDRLGVKMDDYSFDDETGVLHYQDK